MQSNADQKVIPEKAVKMLAKNGITVTLHEAKLILDWMYNLANIALDVYTEKILKDQENESNGSNPDGYPDRIFEPIF